MRIVGEVVRHVEFPVKFERWVDFKELKEDRHGLSVVVQDRLGASIRCFWRGVLGYRVIDEGAYPELCRLVARSPTAVFVLEGASFADEYVEFGLGMVPREGFVHWVVGTTSELIEVLALVALPLEFEVLPVEAPPQVR